MKRFYSATTGTTYIDGLHQSMPEDAVQISKQRYREVIANPEKGKVRGHDDDGLPILIDPPPPDLDTLATRKRAEIDTARDAAFAAGLPYTIAGEPDVVQTRPQDQINLLGLSAKAQRLIAVGDTETTFTFRGLSNVNRTLTATEMDALALAALAHIEGIYQRSWDRKDAVDAILDDEELDEVEKREAIETVEW